MHGGLKCPKARKVMVRAYEMHGRFAIECSDWHELGQCIQVLRDLENQVGAFANPQEFAAYRVLDAATRGNREILAVIHNTAQKHLHHDFVKHAVAVVRAYATGNHAAFFRLFAQPPRMSAYLMDRLVEPMRKSALRVICNTAMASMPLADLADHLAFESETEVLAYVDREGLGAAVLGRKSKEGPHLDLKAAKQALALN